MLGTLERKLTFKPNTLDHGGLTGISYERITFGAEFGLTLDGGFVRKTSPRVVLFFHGNRHNITKFADHYQLFEALGHSYFFFDYPGYGSSPGVPSEKALYTSARAAYSYVRAKLGYEPHDIIVYGCSLGGAISIELLQHHDASCLITESTFTCSWEMARRLYPRLPIWWLFPNRFRNDQRVSNLKLPIFMMHGEADPIVPVEMGRRLFESARSARRLVTVEGANHVNTLPLGGERLREEVRGFLDGTCEGRSVVRLPCMTRVASLTKSVPDR
jgi:hypothetical protein